MDYSDRPTSAPKRSGKSAPVSVGAPPPGTSSANAPGSAAAVDDRFDRLLLSAMLEFRDGNFSVRLPNDLDGLSSKIADTFNEIVSLSDRRADDVERVSRMVGKEGKLKERMNVGGLLGTRADEIAAINTLVD